MWLVFLLLFIVLGIVCSSIELNLYKIELTDKKFDFKLIVEFKLFGLFKILQMKLDRDGVKFLNKIITYKEIKLKAEKDNINISKIDFKVLDINLKKVYFKLKVGLLDIALTNIVIVIFSTIFPLFIKSKVKRKDLRYEIFPEYNKFCLFLNGKISVSIKPKSLIKLYFKNIKKENVQNKSKNYDVKESF